MNYIDKVLERLDIQHIREFLLHGAEEIKIDKRPYTERLETPEKILTSFLRNKFPDDNNYDEITDKIHDALEAVQEVYMEIGLQGGIMLAMQIFNNTKPTPEIKE